MDYYNYMTPNVMPSANGANGFFLPNQPQQFSTPQIQNCPLDNRFAWTSSKEMARTTPMAPDKTILFLNENEDYAYYRRTDNTGKTVEFKTFKMIEEKEPESIETPVVKSQVTREEFETFTKNIDISINELKEMLLASKSNYNKNFNKDKRQVREDA